MTRKLNTDNGLQTQGSRTPAFNMVFAASGVSVPHRTVRCGYESLYLRSSVSAETPRQRKYPNRYGCRRNPFNWRERYRERDNEWYGNGC